jgi:hypothetical protein
MHSGLVLVNGNLWLRVSPTNIKPNLHGRLLFLGNWGDHDTLLVHGDYTI